MGIEQFHPGSRIWHYVEDSKFSMDYDALESYFNERAKAEKLLPEKYWIHIKTIDLEANNRLLNLNTELYKLLEN